MVCNASRMARSSPSIELRAALFGISVRCKSDSMPVPACVDGWCDAALGAALGAALVADLEASGTRLQWHDFAMSL